MFEKIAVAKTGLEGRNSPFETINSYLNSNHYVWNIYSKLMYKISTSRGNCWFSGFSCMKSEWRFPDGIIIIRTFLGRKGCSLSYLKCWYLGSGAFFATVGCFDIMPSFKECSVAFTKRLRGMLKELSSYYFRSIVFLSGKLSTSGIVFKHLLV